MQPLNGECKWWITHSVTSEGCCATNSHLIIFWFICDPGVLFHSQSSFCLRIPKLVLSITSVITSIHETHISYFKISIVKNSVAPSSELHATMNPFHQGLWCTKYTTNQGYGASINCCLMPRRIYDLWSQSQNINIDILVDITETVSGIATVIPCIILF